MKKNKGFTLIELLVVIAIIGILSSVVLASLNSARQKGQDTAIKSNLNNMRAQAEMYFDNNQYSYGATGADITDTSNVCGSPDGLKEGFEKAKVIGQGGHCVVSGVDATAGDAWVAWVPLKTKINNQEAVWCIDSGGLSEERAASDTTTGVINCRDLPAITTE